MVPRRDGQLPLDATRDMLGLCRSLYAAEQARGAGKLELQRVAKAGRLLADAIDLAAAHPPGTVGHFAAWKKAEDGTRLAGECVTWTTLAESVVVAACGRVRRG